MSHLRDALRACGLSHCRTLNAIRLPTVSVTVLFLIEHVPSVNTDELFIALSEISKVITIDNVAIYTDLVG